MEIERLREEVLSLERYRPSRPAMPMSLSSSLSKTSLINDGANTTVGFEHGKVRQMCDYGIGNCRPTFLDCYELNIFYVL